MQFEDESGGKPEQAGVVCEPALSFVCCGKAFRGKPRSKPESGNPTFRDCRGARGIVTLSAMATCARLGSIPTGGAGRSDPEQTARRKPGNRLGREADAERSGERNRGSTHRERPLQVYRGVAD